MSITNKWVVKASYPSWNSARLDSVKKSSMSNPVKSIKCYSSNRPTPIKRPDNSMRSWNAPIEEGGGWGLNLKFYWGIFLPEEGDWTRHDCGHSTLLWCLKQHSVNIEHQQNKISMAYVYIKPEVKKMIQQQWLQLKMKLVLGDYCIKSVIWWGQNETPPKKYWDGELVLKNGSSSCWTCAGLMHIHKFSNTIIFEHNCIKVFWELFSAKIKLMYLCK